MNKTLTFLAFVVGFASGAAVTATYVKKKYERIAQEEIDSVKAAFAKRKDEDTDKEGEPDSNESDEEGSSIQDSLKTAGIAAANAKPSIMEYAAALRDQGYNTRTNAKNTEEEEEEDTTDGPRVISPEEFGEDCDDYETYEFRYYTDHVLADDADEVVHDVNGMFGFDPWDHFGEYEEDAVYIRNDARKREYEILYAQETYADMIARKYPYKAELE
jgi:hypothetical protein